MSHLFVDVNVIAFTISTLSVRNSVNKQQLQVETIQCAVIDRNIIQVNIKKSWKKQSLVLNSRDPYHWVDHENTVVVILQKLIKNTTHPRRLIHTAKLAFSFWIAQHTTVLQRKTGKHHISVITKFDKNLRSNQLQKISLLFSKTLLIAEKKDKTISERPFALHRQQCSLQGAQIHRTTRTVAQWNLVLAHLQHSKAMETQPKTRSYLNELCSLFVFW